MAVHTGSHGPVLAHTTFGPWLLHEHARRCSYIRRRQQKPRRTTVGSTCSRLRERRPCVVTRPSASCIGASSHAHALDILSAVHGGKYEGDFLVHEGEIQSRFTFRSFR